MPSGCIDWTPLFSAWQLRGSYPKILEYRNIGAHARELFADANKLLDEIVADELFGVRAVVGLFAARSRGEDVEVYAEGDRATPAATFHFLRQQQEQRGGEAYVSLADYIASADSGVDDSIGVFAVTAGIGALERAKKFEADHDEYNAIMIRALADRLTEALAEYVHENVRKELWGYATREDISPEQLIKERYDGIRPAAGYPSCPDHSEKQSLFALLDVEQHTGIALTENFAMTPAASVSGYYFAHPQSRYFKLGVIGEDQVTDYAARKGMTVAEVEKWLAPNLAYDR